MTGLELNGVLIALLNRAFAATFLIVAALLLRLLLKRAPKGLTLALWALVALRLILPVLPVSPVSLVPSAALLPERVEYAARPTIESGLPALDAAVNPVLGSSLAATPENSVNPMQIVLFLGGLVWLAGAAGMLLYALVRLALLRRRLAEAVPEGEGVWLCDGVASPFLLGLIRPRIYLPATLPEAEKPCVLAHEREHARRGDPLFKALGFLILAVYWFHPLLWLAYALFCRDLESACDERVIASLDPEARKAYARALVACGTERRVALTQPLAFGEGRVRDRVRAILSWRKPALWLLIVGVVLCAVLAVTFLTDPAAREPDLSLLNYRNAVSLIAQGDGEVKAILCPEGTSEIQIGAAERRALADFLANASWRQVAAPRETPPSPGSVEFVVDGEYRVFLYRERALARVRVGAENRWYRAGSGDYARAATLVHEASPAETATPAAMQLTVEYSTARPMLEQQAAINEILLDFARRPGYTLFSLRALDETLTAADRTRLGTEETARALGVPEEQLDVQVFSGAFLTPEDKQQSVPLDAATVYEDWRWYVAKNARGEWQLIASGT